MPAPLAIMSAEWPGGPNDTLTGALREDLTQEEQGNIPGSNFQDYHLAD